MNLAWLIMRMYELRTKRCHCYEPAAKLFHQIKREIILTMKAKFTTAQANEIRMRKKKGERATELAIEYKCHVGTIHNILKFDGYGGRNDVVASKCFPLFAEEVQTKNERRSI